MEFSVSVTYRNHFITGFMEGILLYMVKQL